MSLKARKTQVQENPPRAGSQRKLPFEEITRIQTTQRRLPRCGSRDIRFRKIWCALRIAQFG